MNIHKDDNKNYLESLTDEAANELVEATLSGLDKDTLIQALDSILGGDEINGQVYSEIRDYLSKAPEMINEEGFDKIKSQIIADVTNKFQEGDLKTQIAVKFFSSAHGNKGKEEVDEKQGALDASILANSIGRGLRTFMDSEEPEMKRNLIDMLDKVFLSDEANLHEQGVYKNIRSKLPESYNENERDLVSVATKILSNNPDLLTDFQESMVKKLDKNGGELVSSGQLVEGKSVTRTTMDSIKGMFEKSWAGKIAKDTGLDKLAMKAGIILLDNLFGNGQTTNKAISATIAVMMSKAMSSDAKDYFDTQMGHMGRKARAEHRGILE